MLMSAFPEDSPAESALLWGAVRAALQELSIPNIRRVAGLAGFDVTAIPSMSEARGGSGSRAEVMPALDRLFARMDERQKRRAVQIIAEEVRGDGSLQRYLDRLGFGFIEGRIVRTSVLSPEDLDYVPERARPDLARAATRLRDGDFSGAVSAICGSIDTATAAIYSQHNLGDVGAASFQERISRALQALGTWQSVTNELQELGWENQDAERFIQNLRGATNQAGYVLQTLRSKMGDVHGQRETVRWMVFDSLKWAEAILALLQNSSA
jgi:hypothetical protein